jgi:competence protein ComEC
VTARWPPGQALASGARAEVTGRWVPRAGRFGRADGTLSVRTVRPLRGTTPSPADRLRNALTRRSERLYGERAPLVDALVLGRRADMDDALRTAFAESGLVHILSISGFHVGLIVAWVVMLLRAARVPRARAMALGAAAAAAYVVFLGWPPPAARAATLAGVLALCFHRQRAVRPNALLAQTCFVVLLVEPWAVVDLGAWLSAGSLWGATMATRWSDRALGPSLWWRSLAGSVGSILGTAPVTAAALGTVAPAGVVVNFAAIPIAAAAVPGVFASLVLAPAPFIAEPLAAGAGLALHLLELTARAGARIPGGHIVQAEELRSAVPWLVVLAVAAWGVGRRNTRAEALRRWALAGGVALWVTLAVSLAPALGGAGSGRLTLHFLDVGQGDGAVIRTPGGRWILIDAGPRIAGADAGRRVVVPFLRRRGVRRIDLLVVSHAHADHLGGAPAVLERIPVALVTEPGRRVADPLYLEFLELLAERRVRWQPGRPPARVTLDGVTLTVLHPDTAWSGWGADLNEDSLVLLVEYGDFQALFAGDAGFPAEARLRGRVGAVDLLKVGHHGSAGSSGEAWLGELRPRVAVVSVGRNTYGHPAPAAVARLGRAGADLWRTDRDGTVTVETDGRTMTLRAGGREAVYPTLR